MKTRSIIGLVSLLLAALGCAEDALTPTETAAGVSQADVSAAVTLVFRQVSAGHNHSCGVTSDNRAYCWGANWDGELGDGTTVGRHRPVAVVGGLSFRQVSAGGYYTCGVTTQNLAYCWGRNNDGQLGDGTTRRRLRPVAVAGGWWFREVSTGSAHTCGLTTTYRALCWGRNGEGQLGDGTTVRRLTPVTVAGGLEFRQVNTGSAHTCGITQANRAYCWGDNFGGALGINSTVQWRLRPTAVATTLQFKQLDAGTWYTCAITTGDRAFCWGRNYFGQLGDGTRTDRLAPRGVAGGYSFRRVSAGGYHTCAVSTTSRAYCWGRNEDGELGDGTTAVQRLLPVAVVGGLSFDQVSAGDMHTCGRTPAGVGYCWGNNAYGQVGDGTEGTDRVRPVKVASP